MVKLKQINLGLKITITVTWLILILGAAFDLQQKWILSGLIAWIFCALTLYWLTKNFTRPLTELAAAMKTLAQGDFQNAKVNLSSDISEVQELITAFNSLRLYIQKFRCEMEFLNMKKKKYWLKL